MNNARLHVYPCIKRKKICNASFGPFIIWSLKFSRNCIIYENLHLIHFAKLNTIRCPSIKHSLFIFPHVLNQSRRHRSNCLLKRNIWNAWMVSSIYIVWYIDISLKNLHCVEISGEKYLHIVRVVIFGTVKGK